MAHPLCGANLETLWRAFRQGGAPDRWGAAAGIWGAALARAPISAAERLAMRFRLPRTSEQPPPIFILGHWRSGTTHLYNTMSLGEFGYVSPVAVGLPWDMFGIASAFRPLLERALPEHRWIDRIPVTPTSPQEDEVGLASMTDLSFYHGIYFPHEFDRLIDRGLFFDDCDDRDIRRWEERFLYFMRKLGHLQGRRMLIKNPVYTGRVAQLRRLFPEARFIFLHRNPFDVFLSMRNFYARLLDVMALQDVPSDLDVDDTILRVYDRMLAAYTKDTEGLSAPDLTEIAYADLDTAPMATLEKIYNDLALDGFERARPQFEQYLASVRSFEKNAFRGTEEDIANVAGRLGPWIERWGYEIPTVQARQCA
ncbi:MAG: sulfotransferase [Pseudomonadota bacterium]